MNCGCLPQRYRSKNPGRQENIWKWGGCSDNVKFGMKFSRMFVDAREKGDDLQSRVNRHNNEVGRRVSTFKDQTGKTSRLLGVSDHVM